MVNLARIPATGASRLPAAGLLKGTSLLRLLLVACLAGQPLLGAGAALAQTATVPAQSLPTLDKAFDQVASQLFEQLDRIEGGATIVIDPLVDGVSGIQTAATRDFDRRIAALVAERYKKITILPLTRENLAKARFVFIGTFNAINNAGQSSGPRDAFWICFALVEPETRTVFARAAGRAQLSDVDVRPAGVYVDRPVWGLDPATQAYIEACQRSTPGSPVAPAYLDQLQAAARISEAGQAFETGNPQRAAELFQEARAEPNGNQLRVLNGLYLSYAALGQPDKAEATFGELVDRGLATGKLGVMFLFEPNSTGFHRNKTVSASYAQRLREIATRMDASKACLQVVGHASRTGPEDLNERLSLERARRIVTLLGQHKANLSPRLSAAGMGYREVLVGLPRDDSSTDVDRRVEFKAIPCA